MSNLRWFFTRATSWKATDAVVDSCDWVKAYEHVGEIAGHYEVKFTYRTGDQGEINHGEFCHNGLKHILPYSVGEHITIRYNAHKPSSYHFSGADANYEKLEAILVVAAFALLAGYFLYAY